jgi:hypothetical protein
MHRKKESRLLRLSYTKYAIILKNMKGNSRGNELGRFRSLIHEVSLEQWQILIRKKEINITVLDMPMATFWYRAEIYSSLLLNSDFTRMCTFL